MQTQVSAVRCNILGQSRSDHTVAFCLRSSGGVVRAQNNITGPNAMPAASTQNAASQPDAVVAPPAASSATPIAHAPAADRPKPTVECSAMVTPRKFGLAAAVMPDVSAPESAGTGQAQKRT